MKKTKRQQYYYWDVVNEGDLYEERQSITLFSCIELQYLCYDKGVSARHYDDHDHDHDSQGSMVVEEEEVEVQEEERQWEALPSTALLNIFCNTELKDRLQSIPLVCKSWKTVTDDPRCWYSMIPDSVSPEDAFIKKTNYKFKCYPAISKYYGSYGKRDYNHLDGLSRLFKEEGEEEEEEEEEVYVGLKRLRTLIKKSGGGAAITTLYLRPFFPYGLGWGNIGETYNEIFHLIANCCPNLKHISFDVWGPTSMEALRPLFNSCKKLELIELFYGGYCPYYDPLKLVSCLPNLQGIRIFADEEPTSTTVVSIAKYFPQLKLLSFELELSHSSNYLSIILVSCLELQYLHVYEPYPMLNNLDHDILHQASSLIPEFYYESPVFTYPESIPEGYGGYYSDNWSEFTEGDELNCFEDDYFSIDYYDDILQQRKEKKEHHYILKR